MRSLTKRPQRGMQPAREASISEDGIHRIVSADGEIRDGLLGEYALLEAGRLRARGADWLRRILASESMTIAGGQRRGLPEQNDWRA